MPFPGLLRYGPPTPQGALSCRCAAIHLVARLRKLLAPFICHRQREPAILPPAARSRNSPCAGEVFQRLPARGLFPHLPQCAHWGTFPRWGKDIRRPGSGCGLLGRERGARTTDGRPYGAGGERQLRRDGRGEEGSPSSAPVCALGHLPPLGEGQRAAGAGGIYGREGEPGATPHPTRPSRGIGPSHLLLQEKALGGPRRAAASFTQGGRGAKGGGPMFYSCRAGRFPL